MFVKSLDLKNFRNIEQLSLKPSPGINILYGSNAQGKTNILEAMYLAGTTRSHRGSRDRDMIAFGREESHIRMEIARRGVDSRIDLHLRRQGKKGIALDGVPLRRAADLFLVTSFVFFSPEDLNLIKNGPAGRRKFLDMVISNIDRVYMSDLANYAKCLDERNALLREIAFDARRTAELDIWDQQLAGYGERIASRRAAFVRNFSSVAAEAHEKLTEGKEKLEIEYEPKADAEHLREKLRLSRDNDLRTRTTNVGIHRDDLAIRVGGMDIRAFGSQGQQRTCALSLKLAEIETIRESRGDAPVLLLDDVLSELDRTRQKALLGALDRTQTFLTCTGLDEFVQSGFHADSIFHVVQGGIQ